MPGPPPNPARRRSNSSPITVLPARRVGEVPVWPLHHAASDEEASLWAEVWARPQAVKWELDGMHRTVARYCRLAILAEVPGASRTELAECRALEQELGITEKAMKSLGWVVAEDETKGRREARDGDHAVRKGARRIKAVDAVAG